jgi:hypothetical protein
MSIRDYAREFVLPSGNYSGISLFYDGLRRLPQHLQILPKQSDDSSTRIMKGIVLFVSGIAIHFFAFWGALWNSWGVGINGVLFLICDFGEKKSILGIDRTQLSNNLKTCLLQGLFGFALYSIPWWVLGLASGAHAGYSCLTGDQYGIEHLQKKVTALIEENVRTPVVSGSGWFSWS